MSTFDPSLIDDWNEWWREEGRPKMERLMATMDEHGPGPVIAHLPASLTGGPALEVLFRAPDQVDVRLAGGVGVWTPLETFGGSVEVRVR